MKQLYLLIILMATCWQILLAQRPYTTTDFLKTAILHDAVLHQQEKINFYKNNSHDLPFLNEFEIRTESDEMDLTRQEYLTRFKFNAPKLRRQQTQLHQKNTSVEEAREVVFLQDALEERYELLLDYWEVLQKISLKEEQQLIGKDQLAVMQKLLQLTTDIALERLIEVESTLYRVELDLLELAGEKARLEAIFQHYLETDANFSMDTVDFISLAKIKMILVETEVDSIQHPDLRYRSARLDASLANMELETIEDRQIFDFFQLKYAGRNQLDFGEEWSIGLGIQIPLKKANQLKMNELTLDNLSNEHRLEARKQQISLELSTLLKHIQGLYQQYDLIKKQSGESQAKFTLTNPTNVPPLTLLQAKRSMLRFQQLLISVEMDIRATYLAILSASGKLARIPLQNYFSENIDSF